MKELSSSMVRLIQHVELYLCPQYCGVVDRRRVIAYFFLTLIEILMIPFHFVLFLLVWQPWGVAAASAHLLAFLIIQGMIWRQTIDFSCGVSGLFVLVAVKLMVDSVFCTFFGDIDDHVSVLGNIFVMFILAISSLSLVLQTTALVMTVLVFLMIGFYVMTQPMDSFLFSLKPMLVGLVMILYVFTYNISKVTKGLRQPREVSEEEKRALEMLANLRDMDYDKAGMLMERLRPELRQRIVNHAAEQLRKEEVERLAWDMVCADLTKSEKEVCKLVLHGKSLKEICHRLGKTESNITSQRCHIRKKLNMERKDDLKRTLEMKIAEIRNAI